MAVKPGYQQTEVGVIPDDWTCGKLEDFFSFISYGFTNPMPTVGYGIYMITAADINDGRIQLETARKTTEVAYRTLLSPKSKPKKNDILLTKDGSLGRLALVGDEQICINQSVAVIRPNEKVEPHFLKMLLESPRYQRQMIEDAGGSTIKHIYITIVNLMQIAVPSSRDEQRAITSALSDMDELLGALERLIAKKRDLKQAVMQQLLTGKTRLPGFQGEWEEKTLGSVLNNARLGGNYSNQDEETEFPLMKMGNLARGHFDLSKVQHITLGVTPEVNHRLCFGDVLLNTRNTLDLVGKVAIWRDEIPAAYFNSNLMRLEFDPEQVCSNQFANYVLNTASVISSLRGLATGTTSVAAIYTRDLMKLKVIVPPLPEQAAIAAVLTDMDAELAALDKRLAKTRALKQGMMQELLTGRKRLV